MGRVWLFFWQKLNLLIAEGISLLDISMILRTSDQTGSNGRPVKPLSIVVIHSRGKPRPKIPRQCSVGRIRILIDLLSFLFSQASIAVQHLDVQLSSTVHDGSSLGGGDGVGDLSGIGSVVHEKKFKIRGIEDSELLEAVLQNVLGSAVGTITDLGHTGHASELSAQSVINTLGLSPGLGHLDISVRLMALEGVGLLLDDLFAEERLDHLQGAPRGE